MDTENTNDDKAMPPASAGSRGKPVAWGVFYGDGKLHSPWDSQAKAECTALTMRKFDHLGVYASPLYRSPTLTEAEREALRKVLRRVREDYFAGRFADSVEVAAVIDGLLERTK